MMLHTKYQGSGPYGFRQEDFFSHFPYISLYRACDPRGPSHFWPQGYNLKLGRGPLGDATYQISRLKGLLGHMVSDKKIFFTFSLYKPI